jgi:hypothetical protein
VTDVAEEAPLVAPRAGALARAWAWTLARRELLAWAFGTRAIVIGSAYLLHRLHRPQGFFPVQYDAFDSTNHVLGAWDGEWYRTVARDGYIFHAHAQNDTAFFPLYPLLIRAVHQLGPDLLLAGLVISNVCFVVAVLAFAALTERLFDADTARRAAIWLCVFPLGFVFSMEYPTSLVLAAMALATLAALADRWLLAALVVALAALARPEGAVLVIPFAVLAWRRRAEVPRGRVAVALVAGPLAVASFPLYLWWHTGNAHAWTDSQRQWDREFHPLGLWHAFSRFAEQRAAHPWLLRDLAFLAVYVVLLLLARRVGVAWEWIVAAAALIVVPLTSGTVESVARFGMVAFAFYWVLARLVRRPWLEGALAAAFIALGVWWMLALPLANP